LASSRPRTGLTFIHGFFSAQLAILCAVQFYLNGPKA
jgi:hypothetical protein